MVSALVHGWNSDLISFTLKSYGNGNDDNDNSSDVAHRLYSEPAENIRRGYLMFIMLISFKQASERRKKVLI